MKILLGSILILTSTTFLPAQIPSLKNYSDLSKNKITPNTNYYRVTAKGFICNRETADDKLESDGKRDEVYLTSASVLTDANGSTIPSSALKTKTLVMGDVNKRESESQRVMAGSAEGMLGGIQAGDQVPEIDPWKNNALAKGDLLPYILWEGELKNNQSVIIIPSIIEWDGAEDFLTAYWQKGLVGSYLHSPVLFSQNTLNYNGNNFNLNNWNKDAGVFPAPAVANQFNNVFFKYNYSQLNGDALNNFVKNNTVITNIPNDRPIGVETNNIYNPLIIHLDNNSFCNISQTDFGYGKGIVPINYKDIDVLRANYTIFYSFEILTDLRQLGRINTTTDYTPKPLGAYKLRNALAGNKIIDLFNGGDTLALNDDRNLNSEKWNIAKFSRNTYMFTNLYNRKVLSMSEVNLGIVSPSISTGIELIRYSDGSFILRKIIDHNPKPVMQTYNMGTSILTPINWVPYNGSSSQRWFIEE